MLATRVNPAGPLAFFNGDVDRIFRDFLGAPSGSVARVGTSRAVPALNVREDEHGIQIEADVPGMRLEDLDIEIVEKELTITGERKSEKEEGSGYHLRERPYGAFRRTIHLPVPIDVSKAEAELKDGVLKVTLPKHEAARSRKIQVKAPK